MSQELTEQFFRISIELRRGVQTKKLALGLEAIGYLAGDSLLGKRAMAAFSEFSQLPKEHIDSEQDRSQPLRNTLGP